jgi:hypothetical protein
MPGRLAEIGEGREAAPGTARINDCNQNAVPELGGKIGLHKSEINQLRVRNSCAAS